MCSNLHPKPAALSPRTEPVHPQPRSSTASNLSPALPKLCSVAEDATELVACKRQCWSSSCLPHFHNRPLGAFKGQKECRAVGETYKTREPPGNDARQGTSCSRTLHNSNKKLSVKPIFNKLPILCPPHQNATTGLQFASSLRVCTQKAKVVKQPSSRQAMAAAVKTRQTTGSLGYVLTWMVRHATYHNIHAYILISFVVVVGVFECCSYS